jgi:hypothetical protein
MWLYVTGRWWPLAASKAPSWATFVHPADQQERRPRRLSAQPHGCGWPSRDRGRKTSVRPDRFIAEKPADGSRASGAKVAAGGSDNGPLSRVPVAALLAALPDAIMYSHRYGCTWVGAAQGDSEGPTFISQAAPHQEAPPTSSLPLRSSHTPAETPGSATHRSVVPRGPMPGSGARSWLRDDHRRPARGRRRPVALRRRWHDPELGGGSCTAPVSDPTKGALIHPCPFRAYLVCPRAGFSRRGGAVTCGAAATRPGRRRRRRCPGTVGPVRGSGRTRW